MEPEVAMIILQVVLAHLGEAPNTQHHEVMVGVQLVQVKVVTEDLMEAEIQVDQLIIMQPQEEIVLLTVVQRNLMIHIQDQADLTSSRV